jgi:ribonuclease P protein component
LGFALIRPEGVRLGLPASRRIRKRREFLSVQERGSRVSLPSLLLLVRARPDEQPARLGITVTRKFGGAVSRNRAKRLIREAFRLSPGVVPNGVDVVVIPKTKADLSDLAMVMGQLRRAAPILVAKLPTLRAELAKSAISTQTAPTRRKRPRP